MNDQGVEGEIQPTVYKKGWKDSLNDSALFRYLFYRQKVSFTTFRNWFDQKREADYEANIDLTSLKSEDQPNRAVIDYFFNEMNALAKEHSFKFVVVMDGDRQSIYQGLDTEDLQQAGVLQLNKMVRELTTEYGVSMIDLHSLFEEDYRQNSQKFNFEYDSHWNTYAHTLVSSILKEHIFKEL